MTRPAKPTLLLLLCIVSLYFTTAITGCLANGAKVNNDDWIRDKKSGTVSCGPSEEWRTERPSYQANTAKKMKNGNQPTKDAGPDGPDKGNGCAHQMNAGALCETSVARRWSLKDHSC
jgi:hypothetical protein